MFTPSQDFFLFWQCMLDCFLVFINVQCQVILNISFDTFGIFWQCKLDCFLVFINVHV